MPITFRYDPELKVLFSTAEGLLTLDDIEAHLYRESVEKALGCRELFDARAAQTDITAEQVRQLVRKIYTMAQNGTFGPTALITNNDAVFGMARMFAILSDLQRGPSAEVFRTYDDALNWLLHQRS
jgi:hypothetical protein